MRSTGGRKDGTSRFLWSRRGEPRRRYATSGGVAEPLMDQSLQPAPRDPRLLSRRAVRAFSKRL